MYAKRIIFIVIFTLINTSVVAEVFNIIDNCKEITDLERVHIYNPEKRRNHDRFIFKNQCDSLLEKVNDYKYRLTRDIWSPNTMIYYYDPGIADLDAVEIKVDMIWFRIEPYHLKLLKKESRTSLVKKKKGLYALKAKIQELINAPDIIDETSITKPPKQFVELKINIGGSGDFFVTSAFPLSERMYFDHYYEKGNKKLIFEYDYLKKYHNRINDIQILNSRTNDQHLRSCEGYVDKYDIPRLGNLDQRSDEQKNKSEDMINFVVNDDAFKSSRKITIKVTEVITKIPFRNWRREIVEEFEKEFHLERKKLTEVFSIKAKEIFSSLDKITWKNRNERISYWFIEVTDGETKREYKVGECTERDIVSPKVSKKIRKIKKKKPEEVDTSEFKYRFVRYCSPKTSSNRLVRYEKKLTREEFKRIGYDDDVCLDVTGDEELSISDLKENGLNLYLMITSPHIDTNVADYQVDLYAKNYNCMGCNSGKCERAILGGFKRNNGSWGGNESYYIDDNVRRNKNFFIRIVDYNIFKKTPQTNLEYKIRYTLNKEEGEVKMLFKLDEKYVAGEPCEQIPYKY